MKKLTFRLRSWLCIYLALSMPSTAGFAKGDVKAKPRENFLAVRAIYEQIGTFEHLLRLMEISASPLDRTYLQGLAKSLHGPLPKIKSLDGNKIFLSALADPVVIRNEDGSIIYRGKTWKSTAVTARENLDSLRRFFTRDESTTVQRLFLPESHAGALSGAAIAITFATIGAISAAAGLAGCIFSEVFASDDPRSTEKDHAKACWIGAAVAAFGWPLLLIGAPLFALSEALNDALGGALEAGKNALGFGAGATPPQLPQKITCSNSSPAVMHLTLSDGVKDIKFERDADGHLAADSLNKFWTDYFKSEKADTTAAESLAQKLNANIEEFCASEVKQKEFNLALAEIASDSGAQAKPATGSGVTN